jgi:hypothetical protein
MQVDIMERDAAYVAARTALRTIQQASKAWPPEIATHANKAASDTVDAILDAFTKEPTSAARRKSLRGAVCSALELAAICDIALAYGLRTEALEDSLRCASRTLSMLGMSFHASATRRD